MSLTYYEFYNGRTGLTAGVTRTLFSEQSPYQKVEVFETDTWGNLMTIDGMVMLSAKDEFVYHEMLTHVAMFTHPSPEKVLIIGGGDGGTAREVLRHPTVVKVDMVEIDEAVIRASRLHFPTLGDWDDPRLNVVVGDGIEFVQHARERYDVIIVDGSDPVGPAEGLFEKKFLQACYDLLTDNGVLTAQTESPWVSHYHPSIKKVFEALDALYHVTRMYLAYIPLYPAGMWSFACAGKGPDPLSGETLERVRIRLAAENFPLKYYNKDIHRAAFALPGFVEDILKGVA